MCSGQGSPDGIGHSSGGPGGGSNTVWYACPDNTVSFNYWSRFPLFVSVSFSLFSQRSLPFGFFYTIKIESSRFVGGDFTVSNGLRYTACGG